MDKVDSDNPPCPECDASKTHKKDLVTLRSGIKKQRYRCPSCGLTFYFEEAEGLKQSSEQTPKEAEADD